MVLKSVVLDKHIKKVIKKREKLQRLNCEHSDVWKSFEW